MLTPAQMSEWILTHLGRSIPRNTISKRLSRGTLPAQPLADGYYSVAVQDLYDMATGNPCG